MPQVRIKGVSEENVIKMAPEISECIFEITGCPKEHIEIEELEVKAVKGNNLTKPNPFIEIYWFDRGQEQADKVAKSITGIAKANGIENIDIAFILLSRNLYYENGEHF